MGFIYCAVCDHNTLQQHATATYRAVDKANCSLRSASPIQLTAFRQVLDCPHLLRVVRRLPIAEVYQNETALAGQALDKHQGRKPPSGRAQNAARSFACTSRSASTVATRGDAYSQRGADPTPNPSIERTCPGKPGHASHVKPMQFNMASHPYR
jgi:hypothetical protein